MKKVSLFRYFSSLIDFAPITILFMSIFIALFIFDISRTADGLLNNNQQHHVKTRSIIKTNLLMQKGLAQALIALQSENESSFYGALELLEGGQSFWFDNGHENDKSYEISLLIEELLSELKHRGEERFTGGLSPSLTTMKRLQERGNEIYSLLTVEDSRNWSETIIENGRKHAYLKQLSLFFFVMCLFLGGIITIMTLAARKSRSAEKSLQELTQELERRVGERTEELSLAYQELVMQANLLQTILDTIPVPIFYKDALGVYLGCNKAFENYIGLPRDRVTGATVYDIAPKELAAIYHRADLELIREGGAQVYETSVRYADSSLHDVLFHKAVFYNQDGSAGGQVGAMLDITEHKKAEAELLKREQLFHGIFNQTFSFMGLLSPEGNLLEVNNTAMAVIDADLDAVLGKPFWMTPWWTHCPEVQQQIRDGVERAVLGQMVRFETTHLRGDRLLNVDLSLKPVKNEQGEILFIIPEGRDISQIKQHEKVLLSIAEGLSSQTGEEFFQSLVLTMAQTLSADYTFVGRFKDGHGDIVETLANCADGIILDNIEYGLQNTPCQAALDCTEVSIHPEDVMRLFPDNSQLQTMGIDGYVGMPLRATSGEPLGILVAMYRKPIRDISTTEHLVKIFGVRAANEIERLQNQLRLEESEKTFRTIFQAGPDAAVVARLEDKIIVDCNDGFSQLTGYDKQEVLGKTSIDLGIWVNPEDRRQMYGLLEKTGRVENFEFLGRKKNGEISDSLLSMRIIQLRGVSHLLVVTRDVTEFKQAQQALQDSEQRYRELYTQFQVLLDGIPDALLLFSNDLKVVWANQGAARHFSRTAEELEGMSCDDLWQDQSGICLECSATVFQDGKSLDMTLKATDRRHWGIKTFPIRDTDGQVSSCIQIASDITEKIRLREHSDQASRLASLGELSAGVAHEINNPNAQLLLNLPLVAEAIADSLPILDRYSDAEGDFCWGGVDYSRMRHEIPKLIEEMQDAAGRIKTIVDDLKNFSRNESLDQGQMFSLNDALKTAVRLSGNTIKNSTNRFTVEYGEDLPLIKCARQRIEQVLVNLIINACQALEERTRGICARTWYDKEQGMVFCEVEDEGVGIEEEVLCHVTDPFFTTRREDGGTGLGLSISARIVKEHGGQLVISSQRGRGTSVAVSFKAN
ncbi:MAG TPA: PAS domain S-box protein [Geopsychrobacteraceae bacterium]|nr:PAS domain S-box protein [Geopsychrobacteraceae bacterium]